MVGLGLLLMTLPMYAVGTNEPGPYQFSVTLDGYVSPETGKSPVAHIWIPDGVKKVKAVMLAQQNMTEERIFKMESFRKKMQRLGVALVWVAPAFTQNWDPQTNCQSIFEEMMKNIGFQCDHPEVGTVPVIPLGHSAQATFPWNFAAWNPTRTLCIISFHGDAPRTNLCGYGRANVEWGRNRNIDGIPGLMVEGEYEWWEARVRPALAFQMMYPESCISFLCDTGRGHFDCGEATADYMARFIEKSMQHRLRPDGTLQPVKREDGWLACRYRADLPPNDGVPTPLYDGKGYAPAAPYAEYKGDRHDAFWYFDKEMAQLTEQRYAQSRGKKVQYVGLLIDGKLVKRNPHLQSGMGITFRGEGKDSLTIHLEGAYTDETHEAFSDAHGKKKPHVEVVSGPIKQIGPNTFRLYPYEAGWDNNRRSFSCTMVVVGDADGEYRGCVQPFTVTIPKETIFKRMSSL
jgi:hypothetical protein